MRQYQQARIWNQIKYSFASIIFITIVIILIIRQDLQLLNKYFKMSSVRDKALENEARSESNNKKSEIKFNMINTDRGVEGYIRQAYPVVKNGEGVITLYNSTNSNVSNVDIEPSSFEKFKNWLSETYNNAIIDYTNNHK